MGCELRLASSKLLLNGGQVDHLRAISGTTPRPLGGDRPLVMLLCLTEQAYVRGRRGAGLVRYDRRTTGHAAAEEEVESLLERLTHRDAVFMRDDHPLRS